MTSHVFWAYPPDYISGPLRLHYWSKGQFPHVMDTDFLPTIIFGDPAQIAFNAGNRGTSLSSCCGRPPPTKFRWHTSSESLFSLPHLDTRFPDFFHTVQGLVG